MTGLDEPMSNESDASRPVLEQRQIAVHAHRDVMARLAAGGWVVCGVGDWATTWRSPDGHVVARVSPFELAYGVFVSLCRNMAGHSMLPRIDRDEPLSGGGRVTVMEYLHPAERAEAERVRERWQCRRPEDPITAVRKEADRLNETAAATIPYWGGLDLNPANVMVDGTGAPKLVDLYFVDGETLYGALLQDPAEFARRIPAHQREHLMDIAYIARMSTAAEIARLRAAAALAEHGNGH